MSLSSGLKNLLLLLVSTVAALVFIEITLRVLNIPPQELSPEVIHDDILVNRMPSDYPEIDSDGFRNGDEVLARADIVAIGDSHTYGYNVSMHDSWPSQFAALARRPVYNMGIGGYGALQYYYLLENALQRKPKYVLLGMYLANDIKDICYAYRTTSYWRKHARSEGLDLQYCNQVVIKDEQANAATPGLMNHIIKSHLAALWTRAKPALARRFHKFGMNQYIVVNDGKNVTLIGRYVIKEHGKNMDVGEPEIASSLAVTKELVRRMAERSRAAGAELVILLVPSKEYVFYDYLRAGHTELPDYYQQTVHNETALKKQFGEFFRANSIPAIDAAPFVIRALSEKGGVYTQDADGHPLAAGYSAYAQAMYEGFWRSVASN